VLTASETLPPRLMDSLSLPGRAKRKLYTLWVCATHRLAAKGSNISIHCPIVLSRLVSHHVGLGNNIIIRKDTWLNILSDNSGDIKLQIDDNCVIGPRCTISVKNFIHLGKDVITASSVLIQDHNHAYENPDLPIRTQGVTPGGRIHIEAGCWIGQGAAIVCNHDELVIGRNSVIAANSLVTRSFPPHSVIVGNPARLARKFDPASAAWIGGDSGRDKPSKVMC
jgi:acetyltransferase-like isoleucine patch superfamily enzyme